MRDSVKVFWDIALWRRGPRDVPASTPLFVVVAALYVATSAVQAAILYGSDSALARGVADLGLTAIVFLVCLAIGKRTYRFRQTLTAVLGTGTLFAVPMIGVLLLEQQVGREGPTALLVSLVPLPLLIWYLFVVGQIVRQALDAPLFTGMAVAMTYFVLSYAVLEQLPAGGPG